MSQGHHIVGPVVPGAVHRLLHRLQRAAVNFLKCCLMGKEAWLWRYFGRCMSPNPSKRGPLPCLLNRLADTFFTKRQLYRMMLAVQGMANRRPTRYVANIVTTTDYLETAYLEHLASVPFGPLMVSAPAQLEAFLRHNYPTLHRYNEEEQARVAGHRPDELSFGDGVWADKLSSECADVEASPSLETGEAYFRVLLNVLAKDRMESRSRSIRASSSPTSISTCTSSCWSMCERTICRRRRW